MPRVPTHIGGFDEALAGGIPQGSLVVVAGTPGTMKTSLCFSIMYNNVKRNGAKGLYITLEQAHADLKTSMEELGMKGIEDMDLYILDVAKIRLEHRTEDDTKDWLDVLTRYIDQRVKDQGFDLVVLDSLPALYSLTRIDNPRRELFHFFGFLKSLRATVFLISEMHVGSPKFAQYDEDFMADGILYVKQFEVGDTDVQLRLRCVKMRKTKHQHGYFALVHNDEGFLVTSVITEASI